MSNYWPGVIADIQGAVASVWQEIDAQFLAVIAKKINWQNLFSAGLLHERYAVFQIIRVQFPNDYGTYNTVGVMEVRLFYIAKDTGTGIVLDEFGKLQAMKEYLLFHDFTSIQMLPFDITFDVGEDEAASVMIEADTPFTVCCIAFQCLVGEMAQ